MPDFMNALDRIEHRAAKRSEPLKKKVVAAKKKPRRKRVVKASGRSPESGECPGGR
jgi:hypothetical protein